MSQSIYGQLHQRFGPRESGTSRRDFLKGMAAAGAAMLLSSCVSKDHPSARLGAGRHVVIVGAGLAGLACGYELRSAGYEVTVLEVRKRLGGRVVTFSDFIPNRIVEGGGELIGANHPLWVAYARQFHLDLVNIVEDESLDPPLILQGKKLENKQAKQLYTDMTALLNTMNDDSRKVDENEPWKTPGAAALDHLATSEWLAAASAGALCKIAVAAQLESNNAVRLLRQSYLGNLTQIKGGGVEKYWTDSETLHCAQGNQTLAKRLAEGIGAERIFTGAIVHEISMGTGRVLITTTDGRSFAADDVVLAVPPTTWSKIRFDPMLPAELSPQMGLAVKYLAMVRSRFWKEAKVSPEGQSDGVVGMTWESTKGEGEAGAVGLTAFSGGPAAEKCRAVSADDRDRFYGSALEQMYPDFREQFMGSRFMDWPGDTWTGCCYSFPLPGQIVGIGPMLQEGMGRLHFAGEHTCYKFVGYMEGALNSGVRIARKIAGQDGATAASRVGAGTAT